MTKPPRAAKSRPKKAARPNVVVPFPADRARLPAVPAHPLRCRFRSGAVVTMSIATRDLERVWNAVQAPNGFHAFVVFDSPNRRIALNLRHLVMAQFDGDADMPLIGVPVSEAANIEVYFSDAREPVAFAVAPDEWSVDDADERGSADEFEELIQVMDLFLNCDISHEASDETVHLRDLSGSSIWLRLNDVALVSAPLGHMKDIND